MIKLNDGVKLSFWHKATISYIIIPVVIFFCYLHSILSLVALYAILRATLNALNAPTRQSKINSKILGACAVFAILISLIGCNVGWLWGTEKNDWEKHNVILNDLVSNSWPVYYENQSMLNYYI